MAKNIFGHEQPMPDVGQPLESSPLPDIYGIGSGGPAMPVRNMNNRMRSVYGMPDDYATPAQDALYDQVMNPPEHERPSVLRMVGTGLLSALQDSTGPKSRVALRNAKGNVVGSREAGFWESLGNNPFNYDEASHILEDPYKKSVADWQLKTNALKDAANIEKTAESNRALAAQRNATAASIPAKTAQGQQVADAKTLTAESQARVRALQTMTDEQKIQAVQSGQYSIEELKQAGATKRTEATIQGKHEDVAAQQTGATARNDATLGSRETVAGMNNDARMAQILATIAGNANKTQTQVLTTTDGRNLERNPKTGQWEEIKVGGEPVTGPLQKPGSPYKGKESANDTAKLESVRAMADKATSALDELLTPNGKDLRDDVKWAVGGSSISSSVPFLKTWSGAAAGSNRVERARNLLKLELMQEIRQASKSGATGMGNMSNDDLKTLEKSSTILSSDLDEKEFLDEVLRIKPIIAKIKEPVPGTSTSPAGKVETEEDIIRRHRRNNAPGAR